MHVLSGKLVAMNSNEQLWRRATYRYLNSAAQGLLECAELHI